jgi:hypothetical protein
MGSLRSGELAAGLRREGVRFVYADHWQSARLRVESGEAIGALGRRPRMMTVPYPSEWAEWAEWRARPG